ncbi:MAG: tRNA 2-thiouridine(34) synthase MnmA [Spirochaetaceae bacterium]|nr:tRNA 2-thiouridine(34) synthase MnmA [Spirochaetaceae bacterium]
MKNNLQIPAGSKAIVAMSGGVDSAVTAGVLLNQGVEVVAATMAHKKEGQRQDINDATAICRLLGIKHLVIDIAAEYEQFLESVRNIYAAALTPNPCVNCNQEMKFGLFFTKVMALLPANWKDCYWASGHYARVEQHNNLYYLAKGSFILKDQSYFLYRLSQDVLQRLRFPLGTFSDKEATRRLAEQFDLPVKEKQDSQDFCLGEELLRCQNEAPAAIVDSNGRLLKQGKGLSHYTIGQRRGLGVAGGSPLYVIKLDAGSGTVVLGDETQLFSQNFSLSNAVFVQQPTFPFTAQVKVRSGSRTIGATINKQANGIKVSLDRPERAITPGQSAVFYHNDLVLGGGYIKANK